MFLIAELISWVVNFLIFVIIIEVVLSWLIAFDVINVRNAQARKLIEIVQKITTPIMAPFRQFIPPIGGIDITPIVAIFLLTLIEKFAWQIAYSASGNPL